MARDPAGSLWALPQGDGPWWATGSHLDSVRAGGRFDGPLGVAAGFAVAERVPGVAVLAFADEEGARFNTPTFGSRALVGRLDVADALARARRRRRRARPTRCAGSAPTRARSPTRRPGSRGCAASWSCTSTRRATSSSSARPPGPCSGLASRLRLALELTGRADHAGTTRRHERADALAAAARLIVAADELAGDDPDFLVTASRILVEPNAFTTVPARVRLWIDARTPERARLGRVAGGAGGARRGGGGAGRR